ncbi:MAG: DUF881 domain-containing protein [Chloroflexi bacterium]|nr:DUF881 domain-containing protein [Chloroflexota bacterium]
MDAVRARLRAIQGWQITLTVALLALGFLIAGQLAAERPRVRYTTQERAPLVETALELQAAQDRLKDRILELRGAIKAEEERGRGALGLVTQLNRELDLARLEAGLVPLRGTGFILRLEDSDQLIPPGNNAADFVVTARDVRTVVEELWFAGAEAVAVTTERVTATTAIIEIGQSVLVNSAYLAPPFTIVAIGPPDLYDRLSDSQGWADFLAARSATYGIKVLLATPESVEVPAFAGTVTLRYAKPAS